MSTFISFFIQMSGAILGIFMFNFSLNKSKSIGWSTYWACYMFWCFAWMGRALYLIINKGG